MGVLHPDRASPGTLPSSLGLLLPQGGVRPAAWSRFPSVPDLTQPGSQARLAKVQTDSHGPGPGRWPGLPRASPRGRRQLQPTGQEPVPALVPLLEWPGPGRDVLLGSLSHCP